MRKLLSYLKPYWKLAFLAPTFMLLEVVTDLMQPFLMAQIVDQGVKNNDIPLIFRTGLLMVGLALLGMLGGIGCTIFASRAAQNFSADLRGDLFKKVQSFSFDNLHQFKTASLVTRLTNDILQVQNVVLAMLRILVRALLLSIGGVIMALLINPGLASILAITIPLLILALFLIIRKGFPLFSEVQRKLDKVNIVMRENLAGVRVIKAFVRADYEKERFASANNDLMKITMKASRLIGLNMPIMFLVMNLSIVAVIWFGGIRVNAGNMLVGQVIAFITYMTQILFSLMMVAFMLIMVSRAKASADRIQEVLVTENEIRDVGSPLVSQVEKGRIDFENVSFSYQAAKGRMTLRNLNFTIMPGETVAILGSTGSGKSTLVHLIPRFYDVIEGRILIDGQNVKDFPLTNLRKSMSLVLQETILFSGTIIDNIRWGKGDAGYQEVVEAAKAAQAHGFIMQLPDGYNTMLGQKGINLSGGQKQRLSIARALLRQPIILILDDSTSAVDMKTEAEIQQALKQRDNVTCLVIAQRISSIREADKVIILEDGEIIASGTHEELRKNSKAYQDIYFSQLGEEVS